MRFRPSSILCAALLTFALGGGARAATTVAVPVNVGIAVNVATNLSSATADLNQTFPIKAAVPIHLNGVLIVQQGAVGEGRVTDVTPAKKAGNPGRLSFIFLWITAVDGSHIPLSVSELDDKGESKKGQANVVSLTATVPPGPVGVLSRKLAGDRDVVVAPDQQFYCYTAKAVKLVAK
jgi:hypothetical protein